MPTSATAPEISAAAVSKTSKKQLPPVVQKSQSMTLTKANIGVHNRGQSEDKVDLDQTTMIGSALDLDSLSGPEEDEEKEVITACSNSHAGSQVGLLKLSAV